ncbi:MAG: hypothetical protein AAFW01_16955 [Pseudomonadota bacterium]
MNENTNEDRPDVDAGAGKARDRGAAKDVARKARLGAALRANLSKRKAQARERRTDATGNDTKDSEHG